MYTLVCHEDQFFSLEHESDAVNAIIVAAVQQLRSELNANEHEPQPEREKEAAIAAPFLRFWPVMEITPQRISILGIRRPGQKRNIPRRKHVYRCANIDVRVRTARVRPDESEGT